VTVRRAKPRGFLIFQDRDRQWRWTLFARNGRIVADSGEAYVSKAHAKRAVASTRRIAATATVVFDKPAFDRL
jgi:uncharacterized protein YegP (UPF0339 family)